MRLLLALLLLLQAAAACAHMPSLARVDIVRLGETNGSPALRTEARIELDLALRDLVLSLPVDANRDEQVTWGELQRSHAAIERFALSGLALTSDAAPCLLRVEAMATRQYDDGAYAALRLHAQCPSASNWRLDYDLFFAADPQHRALVTLHDGASTRTTIARRNARAVVLATPSARAGTPRLAILAGFLREGIHHLLVGYDHLAFLLSLLLPAALLRRHGEWWPSTDFRTPLLQVAGVATAFTLAHSLTLSLAALGWVRPASGWVEPAIASSVVLAAINNVRPWVTRRLWAVGFGFGLIHGFGFAGALGELGLPEDERLLALLGFNMGVELGQLLVIALALPLLFALRRARWYSRIAMPLVSLGIGVLATGWLWQRIAT